MYSKTLEAVLGLRGLSKGAFLRVVHVGVGSKKPLCDTKGRPRPVH